MQKHHKTEESLPVMRYLPIFCFLLWRWCWDDDCCPQY